MLSGDVLELNVISIELTHESWLCAVLTEATPFHTLRKAYHDFTLQGSHGHGIVLLCRC